MKYDPSRGMAWGEIQVHKQQKVMFEYALSQFLFAPDCTRLKCIQLRPWPPDCVRTPKMDSKPARRVGAFS